MSDGSGPFECRSSDEDDPPSWKDFWSLQLLYKWVFCDTRTPTDDTRAPSPASEGTDWAGAGIRVITSETDSNRVLSASVDPVRVWVRSLLRISKSVIKNLEHSSRKEKKYPRLKISI
ncbi:hypothetical protein TNIN_377651 [Trichonephila inaurata madagascariensis]|uniref:Uncharacterized protein n=1 Tax=Trichonephila inaurata madagascariensis TaxID=2747483 RepID=A0A8X6YAM0_9ARAC|nr:hypothetical protein TNIN_377651 [Trichonephila inaurata madagascariensis]